MVRDLLQGFVREDWIEKLDFNSLEKVSGSYISDDLRDREDDIIWRAKWGKSWLYVYLLLEFQSTVDRFMAVRILTYVGLLYQDLIKSGQVRADQLLPPVFPLVLYNGEKRWNAATEIADLIQPMPGGLSRYRPHMGYLVLDEGRYDERSLAPGHNLAAALFRLENSRSALDIQKVVKELILWLRAPEQRSLQRAFTVWLKRVLLPGRLKGVALPELNELHEVEVMLAERVKEWTREWKEEGFQQGREDGLKEGLKEGLQKGHQEGVQLGEATVLTHQIERKFGSLSEAERKRIHAADIETLLQWSERILTANTKEDVFK